MESDCLVVKVLPPPYQDGYYTFQSQGPNKPDARILHPFTPSNSFGFQCCCDLCKRSIRRDFIEKVCKQKLNDGRVRYVLKRFQCNKILAPYYFFPLPDSPFPAEYKTGYYRELLDDGITLQEVDPDHHGEGCERCVPQVITIDSD